MNKPRFFSAKLEGESIELVGEEAHHLVKVRRVRIGEEVELFDGQGKKILGRLSRVGKGLVRIEVLKRYRKVRNPIEITVACAVAKGSRWNWLLEKCTELGAGRIWPVVFERSVARGSGSVGQLEKWRRRCIEAAKQCGQGYLPEVAGPRGLAEILQACDRIGLKLLGTMKEGSEPILGALEKAERAERVMLLIGPEGGLTEADQRLAEQQGCRPVFLAENTLRVETAAVALLAAVRAWEDKSKIKLQNTTVPLEVEQ